jgi:hypothetical protein
MRLITFHVKIHLITSASKWPDLSTSKCFVIVIMGGLEMIAVNLLRAHKIAMLEVCVKAANVSAFHLILVTVVSTQNAQRIKGKSATALGFATT